VIARAGLADEIMKFDWDCDISLSAAFVCFGGEGLGKTGTKPIGRLRALRARFRHFARSISSNPTMITTARQPQASLQEGRHLD